MKTCISNFIAMTFRGFMLIALSSCVSTGHFVSRSSITASPSPAFTHIPPKLRHTPTEANAANPIPLAVSPLPITTHNILPTIMPTLISTLTPAPTLSSQEAQVLIKDLFENSSGCRLPCWWRMLPGQTDWNTARHFLETFVDDIGLDAERQIYQDGSLIYQADYHVSYTNVRGAKDSFVVYVDNGVITEIITGGLEFRLPLILTKNGSPDEVFIRAHRVTNTGDPPPFGFILYYGRKHFWAQFDLEGKLVGDVVRACPQSTEPVMVWLGSPARERTLGDLFHFVFGPSVPGFPEYPTLPLKEATGMDVDTFTTVFKDPNNQRCIETPAELWH